MEQQLQLTTTIWATPSTSTPQHDDDDDD